MKGEFGECDGVVWKDGEYDVFSSLWTPKAFKNQIQSAEKAGYQAFKFDTPVSRFSMADVIDTFASVDKGIHRLRFKQHISFYLEKKGRRLQAQGRQ